MKKHRVKNVELHIPFLYDERGQKSNQQFIPTKIQCGDRVFLTVNMDEKSAGIRIRRGGGHVYDDDYLDTEKDKGLIGFKNWIYWLKVTAKTEKGFLVNVSKKFLEIIKIISTVVGLKPVIKKTSYSSQAFPYAGEIHRTAVMFEVTFINPPKFQYDNNFKKVECK